MNAKATKHIPERKCAGCQGRFPKASLVRILRTPEGGVLLDLTGKTSGRGAYICKSAVCLAKARKTGFIERSLKCSVPSEVYERIAGELI